MANRLVHAGYDVYIGDDLVQQKAHVTHSVDPATLRISGTPRHPAPIEYTKVEKVGDTTVKREHTMTFVGTNVADEEEKITAIKVGCGCSGKAR